jgi:hypothetical protein
MQELEKSVAFAQQELAKMEEELASVEARAVAGLIARDRPVEQVTRTVLLGDWRAKT